MKSVTFRNWLFVLAAATVTVVSVRANLPAGHPTYLVIAEACGMLLPCAVPALALQQWMKTPRAYHVVTLTLALVVTCGTYYVRHH